MSELSYDEQERKWRARSDARTLAEAEVIKRDKARKTDAQKAAAELLMEQEKEINGLKSVANKGNPNSDIFSRKGSPATIPYKMPKF